MPKFILCENELFPVLLGKYAKSYKIFEKVETAETTNFPKIAQLNSFWHSLFRMDLWIPPAKFSNIIPRFYFIGFVRMYVASIIIYIKCISLTFVSFLS